MNKVLYKEIFRRKSFHTFRQKVEETISQEEIYDIYAAYKKFDSLFDIKTDIKIVKAKDTTCNRHEEYCICLFSEIKEGYLQNIGYLGEQLDLYLVSKNIGTLWYGIAKSDEVYHGLNYVIMIAMGKAHTFREDMFKAKRKDLDEIWSGEILDYSNVVRFAPSACNSQPWFVENINNKLYVYRISKSKRISIMSIKAARYFNQIDIGIFLCFIEICLLHNNYKFKRELFIDNQRYDEKVLNATYELLK